VIEFVTRRLTAREKALMILVAGLAFTTGLWAGVWMVPNAALDVPMDTYIENGHTVRSLTYQPVPTYLPILSGCLVLVTAGLAWRAAANATPALEEGSA